ncbi:MAG: mercury(II) reductase [Gammaproteobacteria bacterium]|nr:mercury(II) reductase [Gammaproteobacteria bacterium]
MSTRNNYDIAVIGAGSAGFSAAITAAEQGAKVALIGHGTIGGTCVNVGCVPSKTMIRAAETLHHARAAHRFNGIDATATINDWSLVIAGKDQLVEDLRNAKYIDVLSSYDSVTYLEGKAELAYGGVTVDGEFLKAEKTIITTGSHATIPVIEGIEKVNYLTSTTALELDHVPDSMIVIGGGVIGCELGQLFARLGTKVTILCRSRLLQTGEPEVSEALENALVAEGISIKCGSVYKSISHDGGICLAYEQCGAKHEVRAEQLLIATGRRANTDALGAEAVGVEQLPNAGIKIDDRMRTSRQGVYAAGDVIGKDMFVYMAAYGAKVAVENALNGDTRQYDSTAMPEVVFTDPQVATVGLTEAEARTAGHSVITSIIGMEHVPRALAARDTRGLIKLVADAETRALLGAHIIAPEGADSIQTAAIAIKAGMTVDDLGSMIFPYLTTVEGLKLAAQTFDKDVSKLSCCAG